MSSPTPPEGLAIPMLAPAATMPHPTLEYVISEIESLKEENKLLKPQIQFLETQIEVHQKQIESLQKQFQDAQSDLMNQSIGFIKWLFETLTPANARQLTSDLSHTILSLYIAAIAFAVLKDVSFDGNRLL